MLVLLVCIGLGGLLLDVDDHSSGECQGPPRMKHAKRRAFVVFSMVTHPLHWGIYVDKIVRKTKVEKT